VGRDHVWEIEPARLDEARRWLDHIARQWDEALARLKESLESRETAAAPQRPASAPLGMLLSVAPRGSVAALARTMYTMKLAAMPAAPNKKFGNVT